VQDTKLFETILRIQAPWRISRVVLDTSAERIDLWAEHAAILAGRGRSASKSCRVGIMSTNVCGGTSIRVNTRRSSTPECLASTVLRTACARSARHGPRSGVGSRS
jgi:hypothetical protein